LLQEYQAMSDQEKAGWEAVTAYVQLAEPLRDALKSITGMTYSSAKGWAEWWQAEGKKFEVIDK
jgi:hypothetical protein